MKRPKAPQLLGLLWAGWVLVGLALVFFGATAYSERVWSQLTLRRTQAVAITGDLAGAFHTLEGLPRLLVGSARDAAESGTLDERRLADLRAEGEPFCRLYWVDRAGAPRLAGDASPPGWLWSLAARRQSANVQVLRPLPPGLEAGRLTPEQVRLEEDTPEQYVAAVVRGPGGDVLVAELDLEYVFGPWLKKRLERSPLGGSMTGRPGGEGLAETPPEPSRPGLLGAGVDEVWRWSAPTFFAASQHPFAFLELTLDNGPALALVRSQSMKLNLLVLGLMAAFALALSLAGRAVRRETEYAQARSRFTEMVSHELRTPLSAIAMYGEILREGLIEDPDKIATYHAQLAAQTDRLKRLVEGVLTFGRLEGAEPAPDWRPVCLAEVAEQARAAVVGLGARVDLLPMGPECDLLSDADMLAQILVNLVENAVKYGGAHGPVEISARPLPDRVVLEVADRGPGVAEADRAEIFKPYTRVQRADSPKKEGLGLGLAVVDRLTRALGGSVCCLDRPGGGSVFALSLPRKEA